MRFWFLCLLLIPHAAQAITLEEVLRSSERHYPTIIAAQEKIEAQKGALQQAEGAFDWELNNQSSARTHGYYDGRYSDSQLTRRFSFANARVYGGYRASDGTFPVYEDKNITLSRGEWNAGITFSLWRDLLIDPDRFAYQDSALALRQSETEALLTRLKIQYQALQAWLEWVTAGQSLKVIQELALLAEQRQKGFETRALKGDLAQIALVENRQYILKRQADRNEAERLMANKALALSLYLRDDAGNPILPAQEALPSQLPVPDTWDPTRVEADIEAARAMRPEMVMLQFDQQRERNRLQLGENALMPRVDLSLETARDLGNGSVTRDETDHIAGVKLSIPLQRNTGEGMVKKSAAQLKQLELERRLLHDRIANEIRAAATDIEAARTYVSLTAQEAEATRIMEVAERRRFHEGAADFFVLNMREEKNADAQLRHVESQAQLWNATARYYLSTLKTEKLLMH